MTVTTTPTPVRIALIGCGKMGLQHIKAISAIPGATLVAVADPAGSEAAIRPSIPEDTKFFTDTNQMLAQVKPDVVHIVTPPATHAPLALASLAAGCHVYLEKPFASTAAEADEILSLAGSRGLLVCAGHQCLFERPALAAASMLKDIGRVVHIESFFGFRMVRRNISAVEQCKDILPHAIYPVVQQSGAISPGVQTRVELVGVDASAAGDVYALIRIGEVMAIITVTLTGRPVEQYQNIIGTNGSLRVDYITGSVVKLTGPGTGVGVMFTPYRRAFQTLGGATKGFWRLIVGGSYPGLRALFGAFYQSVRAHESSPLSPESIRATVDICERIGSRLDAAEEIAEAKAADRLRNEEAALPAIDPSRGTVLVSGGTGLLGRPVVSELRQSGFRVRALSRRIPPPSQRVPGVEYSRADLGGGIETSLFQDVSAVVHCAAETAGGQQEHQRNSIDATRNLLKASAAAGVKRFIHISSIAVLKTGREMGGVLSESTPIDAGTLARGPYVWGKAESETLAIKLGSELGVAVKVLRPGPLVDYSDFNPPGRLGRELGPWFAAIGGKKLPLSVCDVNTAARIIRHCLQQWQGTPDILNMLEGVSPTRKQLAERYGQKRADLKFFWVPLWLLRIASPPMSLAQRLLLKSKNPINIYDAFAAERYDTTLAASVNAAAQSSREG